MARKPSKRTPKTPTVAQRLKAQAQERARTGDTDAAHGKRDLRVDKAQLAWSRRQYDEAIRHYEAALARRPRDPVLLVDVARAYALRFRYEDAEKLIELAQRLYPDDADLQRMLARSYAQVQQFDRAIACYRRFLELRPEAPDRSRVLLELAKMLERLHKLDDARQCVQQSLDITPMSPSARFTLAVIERRSGNVTQAESIWGGLIADETAPPGIAADSGYELAAVLDAAGRYEEAHAALIRAKAVLDRAAIPHREEAEEISRTSRTTFATITAEHTERWATANAPLKPLQGKLALLTSHPRSGTTLLEQVLDSHPGAISADELQVMAEMVYMPLGQKARGGAVVPALDEASAEDLNQVRQSYWRSMEGSLRQPIAGLTLIDKNPELTLLLPLVARAFPEMSIIFALRDPRDVVVSCFMQRLPLNAVSVRYLSLESAAKKYAATMRAWLKIRDLLRNRWLEVRYEDCVANIEQQARRVLEFLELPWDEQVLDSYHRRAQTKHVHSPTYEAVTKPVYASSVGRWRHYEAQLAPVMDILRPYIEAFGYA